MRPQLLPGLRRLWRDTHTLQLGIDPRRAIILTEIDENTNRLLSLLDGHKTLDEIHTLVANHGLGAHETNELIDALNSAGVLIDTDSSTKLPQSMPLTARHRLAPDLAALRFNSKDPQAVLANRTSRRVEIHTRGRVGPVLATLLAASGVGHINLIGNGETSLADACIGGILPTDEHRPYISAAADAVRRAAPETVVRTSRQTRNKTDLKVFTDAGTYHAAVQTNISYPHVALPVLTREGTIIVGPLVIPGQTPCLNCLELHRRDHDPAWPALAAQLATTSEKLEAAQTVTVVAAAALAATQILRWFDGAHSDTLGTAVELDQLSGHFRRRSWSVHPNCRCGAQSVFKDSTTLQAA